MVSKPAARKQRTMSTTYKVLPYYKVLYEKHCQHGMVYQLLAAKSSKQGVHGENKH